MSIKQFRQFFHDLQNKLSVSGNSSPPAPHSPPDWQRLDWQVGWVIEEKRTGLHWLFARADQWEKLTSNLGTNRQQKTAVLAGCYEQLLMEFNSALAVSLEVESIRWRRTNFSDLANRSQITRLTWWQLSFSADTGGQWNYLFPDQFFQLFDDSSSLTSDGLLPPWKFTWFWKQLTTRNKRCLLQLFVSDKGLKNHLVSLVVAGRLPLTDLKINLSDSLFSEFERDISRRQAQLHRLSVSQQQQTAKRWALTAEAQLVDQLGRALETGRLSGPGWQGYQKDWKAYRVQQLELQYDDKSWGELWLEIPEERLQQLLPRFSFHRLALAFSGVDEQFRDKIKQHLSSRCQAELEDLSSSTKDRWKILRARRQLALRLSSEKSV